MEVVQNLFYSKLSNPRTQRESIHSRLEVLTTEGGKMKRLMVVAVLLTVASLL